MKKFAHKFLRSLIKKSCLLNLWLLSFGLVILAAIYIAWATNLTLFRLKDLLHQEISTLSYESTEILDVNMVLLEGVTTSVELDYQKNKASLDDLPAIFKKHSWKLGHYTNISMAYVDPADNVIIISGYKMNIDNSSLSNLRQSEYLKAAKIDHENIHIGSMSTNYMTDIPSIPLLKAIVDNKDDYLGVVIVTIPLSKLSERLSLPGLSLSGIEFKNNDTAHQANLAIDNIESVINSLYIIKAAFGQHFDLAIEALLRDGHGKVFFKLSSGSVKKLFWRQFYDRFIPLCSVIGVFVMLFYLFKRNADWELINQAKEVENKNKRLSTIQKNWIACFTSIEEGAAILSEDIEDIKLDHVNNSRQKSAIDVSSALNDIYLQAKVHENYIASMRDTLVKTHEASSKLKVAVDIGALLENEFQGMYNSLSVEEYDTKSAQSLFYLDGIRNVFKIILSNLGSMGLSSGDIDIILRTSQEGDTRIDIYSRNHYKFDSSKLNKALMQAKIIALLDGGVIEVNYSDALVVISLVFAACYSPGYESY